MSRKKLAGPHEQWTDWELAQLFRLWPVSVLSAAEIATLIGTRTARAVHQKARLLGLPPRAGGRKVGQWAKESRWPRKIQLGEHPHLPRPSAAGRTQKGKK